jgi:hypothetical protein
VWEVASHLIHARLSSWKYNQFILLLYTLQTFSYKTRPTSILNACAEKIVKLDRRECTPYWLGICRVASMTIHFIISNTRALYQFPTR